MITSRRYHTSQNGSCGNANRTSSYINVSVISDFRSVKKFSVMFTIQEVAFMHSLLSSDTQRVLQMSL